LKIEHIATKDVRLSVAKQYEFFIDFCNTLIGHLYNNVNIDYRCLRASLPKTRNEVLARTDKSLHKSAKVKKKRKRFEYYVNNGTMFIREKGFSNTACFAKIKNY
jgi:hypothetical protein